jgi:hypothetical protein
MAEPLKATFFAFHKREKGGVLLGASIAFGVVMVLLLIAFAVAIWAIMGQDFFTWSQQMAQMSADAKGGAPGALPPGFGRILLIFPIEMVWLFFFFVALAAFESSCLRWMIRGERSSPFNLHFGADMWRVYGVYWMWFLYFLVTYFIFAIVIVVATLIGASAGGQNNPAVAGVVVGVVCIAWILGWVYVATRLAPASATSVGTREFAPLKGWTVSRDRFWALFGSYFVLFLLYLIVLTVLWGVFFGATYLNAFSHVDWTSLQSDPQSFSQRYSEANLAVMREMFGSPAAIAIYIAGQVVIYAVGVVFWLLFYGINARAVIAAARDGKIQAPGVDVAEQFS